MNCFMCDDDQGVSARAPKEALPDITDEALAGRLKESFERIAETKYQNTNGIRNPRIRKLAEEQREFDIARAVTCGEVREEPWFSQTSSSAADAIIIESQASELEIEVELVKLCLYMLNIQTFTIVFEYLPACVWAFLVLRLRNDLRRLTHLCKRHVPMYPTSDDPLGGLQWWLKAQTWACVIIVGLIFVSSTGCMEAWVELFQPESCSVVTPVNTTPWKFPECSADFVSDIPGYSESIDQADEGWPIGTPIPQEVMSINRASCRHSIWILSTLGEPLSSHERLNEQQNSPIVRIMYSPEPFDHTVQARAGKTGLRSFHHARFWLAPVSSSTATTSQRNSKRTLPPYANWLSDRWSLYGFSDRYVLGWCGDGCTDCISAWVYFSSWST